MKTVKEMKVKLAVEELIEVAEDSKKVNEQILGLLEKYGQKTALDLVHKVIARTDLAIISAKIAINS